MTDTSNKELIKADFPPYNFPLRTSQHSFRPNHTTLSFWKATKDEIEKERDRKNRALKVLDLGSGVGPLAIAMAMMPQTSMVHASEFAKKNYELLLENLDENIKIKNILPGKLIPFHGDLYQRLTGNQYDLILCDVSGLADSVSPVWYPEGIPTGGPDGTKVVTRAITEAPNYMAEEGKFVFGIAYGLSDGEAIYRTAKETFKTIEKRAEARYQIKDSLVDLLKEAPLQVKKGISTLNTRTFWNIEIYVASNPK